MGLENLVAAGAAKLQRRMIHKGMKMPRPKSAVPTVLLKAMIPLEQRAKVDLLLCSDLEGRIPLGDISKFVSARLTEYFDWEVLDLAPFGFAPGTFVKGPKTFVDGLRERLYTVASMGKGKP